MTDHNKNKWREKLDQFPPPEAEGAWDRMEVLLNRRMPVHKKNAWKYAYIMILLLLVTLGVCNCPGINRLMSGKTGAPEESRAGKYPDRKTAPSGIQEKEEKQPVTQDNPPGKTDENIYKEEANNDDIKNMVSRKEKREDNPDNRLNRQPASSGKVQNTTANSHIAQRTQEKEGSRTKGNKIGRTVTDNRSINDKASQRNQQLMTDSALKEKSDTTTGPVLNDTLKKDTTAVAVRDTATVKDSTPGNAEPGTKEKQPKEMKKLRIAFGFNQFIPVNGQKHSAIGPGGTYEAWSGLIPVITTRYYFSEKWYAQAELQWNAPQFTGRHLLYSKINVSPGPSPASARRIESNIYTKKIFYTDVPVSLHVSPFNNFFIGGGLQYSHLRKAIGTHEEKQLTQGRPDSIISIQFRPVDPALTASVLKKNEWRYLASASFRVKKFDLGLRYNRSFSPFINETAVPAPAPKIRNTSLLVYLRYELVGIK